MRHGAFSLGREPISHEMAATLRSKRTIGGAIVR
jgi:hypothetical protein